MKLTSLFKPAALMGWIILAAILLRMGMAIYLGDNLAGSQQLRAQDQVSYDALARSLLAGRGYSFEKNWYPFTKANTPTAHWSFLYPLFLAGVYLIFGHHPLAARLVQVMISGILGPWLTYRLGKRLFGKTVGLVSAGLLAVYAYFIFYDATLMTESLFILGILGSLNLALQITMGPDLENSQVGNSRPTAGPSGWLWLWLGIILGFTVLLRQTVLLWLPFLLIWMLWAGKGRFPWWKVLIPLAIMAGFILPWTIRNYRVYGALIPLNSNAAYALYSANHPNQGTHFDSDYVAPLPADLVVQNLNEAQWSSELMKRGFQFIIEDPARYILLTWSRVWVFFNFWSSPESSLLSNLMRIFSFGLYLPFYILGLIFSRRKWRISSLLYLFGLIYSLMHILTWASIRYRLPVDAALMPFAALAVVEILTKLKVLHPATA